MRICLFLFYLSKLETICIFAEDYCIILLVCKCFKYIENQIRYMKKGEILTLFKSYEDAICMIGDTYS